MRPQAGTAIPLSMAQARITFGSRVGLAGRDDLARVDRRRPLAPPSRETARLTAQYLSSALDNAVKFFFDRSSSRHSPFQPIRTVSAPSDPSRSSTSTSPLPSPFPPLSMATVDDIYRCRTLGQGGLSDHLCKRS